MFTNIARMPKSALTAAVQLIETGPLGVGMLGPTIGAS